MPKLFAVYGTLKNGWGNHRIIKDAKFLGTFKTEPKYTMVSLGGFPAVIREGNTQITYEVYEAVNDNMVNHVYSLEGYSGVRGSSKNWYDTDLIETPVGQAEMFVMDKGSYPDASIVEDGVWKK